MWARSPNDATPPPNYKTSNPGNCDILHHIAQLRSRRSVQCLENLKIVAENLNGSILTLDQDKKGSNHGRAS